MLQTNMTVEVKVHLAAFILRTTLQWHLINWQRLLFTNPLHLLILGFQLLFQTLNTRTQWLQLFSQFHSSFCASYSKTNYM